MNFYNHLISGDHKGYASLQMERQQGATYQSADDFVAAFAQLNWEAPLDTPAGDYRLTHFGYDNIGNAFSGVSQVIQIK
jgi:hypothetical protein